MAKSVTNETKAKFESLLKVALNKKSSKSTQNLLEKENTTQEESSGNTNEAIDLKSDVINKNFILNKFLNDDEVKENNENTFTKPPIPKPRKKLVQQSSSESRETYSVKSAKILNAINKNSDDSKDTYDLPRRISRENSESSSSSGKTFNIERNKIGDIIHHGKYNKTSIVELNKGSSISPHSHRSHQLSGHEIEMANFAIGLPKMQSIEDILSEDKRGSDSLSDTKLMYENETKGKKKKKKKESVIETVEMDETLYKYEKILNIIVHKTDKLDINSFVIHPVVKVYVIDYETGQFIKKSNKSRSAVFYMENKNLTYIMPIMTQNYNLQEKRQFKPEWEESIIINEDFTYIIDPNTKAILFFELLDFVGFSKASSQPSDSSRGWHKIAWAFLKIIAADGTTNTGQKLRLQLYKPGKSSKQPCPVFDWWRRKRIKYPATLYVTVKEMISPDSVKETFRSKTPLEKEISLPIVDDNNCDNDDADVVKDDKIKVQNVLTTMENKICNIPNNKLADMDSGEEGCFVVKFSNTGKYLACAVVENGDYSVVVYTVPDFENFRGLPAHQELIYNICFSKDDTIIASSSSDGTVSIWNLQKWNFLQILPHPSFVYWCEFANDNTIATACYDKFVRIWTSESVNKTKSKEVYPLSEELEGHTGYVTCLCFNSKVDILYSSDGQGEIFIWKKTDENWSKIKILQLLELKNVIINQIFLHKNDRKLVIHSRDNVIRIVDIKNECTLYWLDGAANNRVRTLCCITPCGSYIISGSDNGFIHIWNADIGKSVATYQPYYHISGSKPVPINSVDFSPVGNLMAFSHFGHSFPIFIYNYDYKKCSTTFSIVNEQRRLKRSVPKKNIKETNKKGNEEKFDSEKIYDEKDIDLQIILEKIDKIVG